MRPIPRARPRTLALTLMSNFILLGGVVAFIVAVIEFVLATNDVFILLTHLWCASLFAVTGGIGVAASESNVSHRKAGLRTGFITLSILVALLFGPYHAFTALVPAIITPGSNSAVFGWILGSVGVLTSLLSAVASAAFCCCMPIKEYEVEAVPVQLTSTDPSVIDMPHNNTDTSTLVRFDHLQTHSKI